MTVTPSELDTIHDTSRGVVIRTYPNKLYIDLIDPDVNDIWLQDIAWHLSGINRFNGATAVTYTVLEHCLAVSTHVERKHEDRELALAALGHDMAEAYVGDMNGLLKASPVGAAFREVEDRFARRIEERLGLPYLIFDDKRIKEADREMFDWECSTIRDYRFRKPAERRELIDALYWRARELMGETFWKVWRPS